MLLNLNAIMFIIANVPVTITLMVGVYSFFMIVTCC